MRKFTPRFAAYIMSAVLLLRATVAAASGAPIEEAGFKGGLVVHVGATDTDLGCQLVEGETRAVVQVLLKDGVENVREALRAN